MLFHQKLLIIACLKKKTLSEDGFGKDGDRFSREGREQMFPQKPRERKFESK
jgi:hypothetical protein